MRRSESNICVCKNRASLNNNELLYLEQIMKFISTVCPSNMLIQVTFMEPNYMKIKNREILFCSVMSLKMHYFYFHIFFFILNYLNVCTVQSLALKLTVLRSTFLCLSIVFSLATVILYAKNLYNRYK
jgi:hypothetical protein